MNPGAGKDGAKLSNEMLPQGAIMYDDGIFYALPCIEFRSDLFAWLTRITELNVLGLS